MFVYERSPDSYLRPEKKPINLKKKKYSDTNVKGHDDRKTKYQFIWKRRGPVIRDINNHKLHITLEVTLIKREDYKYS